MQNPTEAMRFTSIGLHMQSAYPKFLVDTGKISLFLADTIRTMLDLLKMATKPLTDPRDLSR